MLMLFIGMNFTNAQQTQNEKIVVDVNDLTPEQFEKIKAKNELESITQKVESYGKWVGVGNEIGVAIKEGLMAVVDVSDKFGNTNVGKYTMLFIGWKIIGADLIRILLGLLFIIFYIKFVYKISKNLTTRRVLIKGSFWKFWEVKEYKVIEPDDYEGVEFMRVVYLLLIAGGFGLTYAIMFA